MKITEETIWSFIDGDLSPEEADMVSHAIAHDEGVSNLYLELLEQHDHFRTFFKMRQAEQGAKSFSTMLGNMRSRTN